MFIKIISTQNSVAISLIRLLAAVPLLIIMLVTFFTTKLPLFLNEVFWEMMHASRTDWAMGIGSIFLLMKGGGKYSIDRLLLKERNEVIRK